MARTRRAVTSLPGARRGCRRRRSAWSARPCCAHRPSRGPCCGARPSAVPAGPWRPRPAAGCASACGGRQRVRASLCTGRHLRRGRRGIGSSGNRCRRCAERRLPLAAACLTSAMVTAPSVPVAATRLRSTPSLRAIAPARRGATTASACSACTALELMAPTTVPASSRSAAASLPRRQPERPQPAAAAGSVRRRRGRCGMTMAVAGVLAIGTLRQVRVQFEAGQHRAGRDDVAGTAGQLQHLAGERRGTSTTAFAVSIDTSGSSSLIIAFLDEPLDDGRVRRLRPGRAG